MQEFSDLWMANNLDNEGFKKAIGEMRVKRRKKEPVTKHEVADEWKRLMKDMAKVR